MLRFLLRLDLIDDADVAEVLDVLTFKDPEVRGRAD